MSWQNPFPRWARRRLSAIWRRRAAQLAATAAVVTVFSTGAPAGASPGPAAPVKPAVPAAKPVPYYVVHGTRAKTPDMRSWQAPVTSWPAAGTASVTLSSAAGTGAAGADARPAAGAGPGAVRAGGLPVWAASVPGAAPPGQVQVSVASRQDTTAAGVRGLILTVGHSSPENLVIPSAVASRAGTAAGPGIAARVHVSVNYSSFAYAYGGDYASRLRLVELPACALTTPQAASCRKQAPLPSANDLATDSLGADVTLPAPDGTAAPALVLAATAAPSGSAGDFTATALSEAGTWSAGGESGAFTYSYPVSVPPVPGGLEPTVALGYDSQSVDGLTSSTNDQASWVGDGWDYAPGSISRSYQSCENNTGTDKTGDFCYSSDAVTTLSLGGQETTLVQDSSTGAWHPEDDNGEKIAYDTTGSTSTNGTYDGGYWVITESDGTKYYFGMNELPGYASGDATTNSAWTLPVYSTASGQPCYKTTFADSKCAMAWQWNLDYVTDTHGDAIAYFYNDTTNYYASDNGTTANASYIQGGDLSKIEYGLRAGSIYGATPAADVAFTTASDRTDVPTDLTCANGASCDVISPTFWTQDRLTTIATQALEGSSLARVDSYALAQTYPATGDTTTPPSMWLSSITRTAEDGTALLPAVTFGGTPMPNRVETPADTSDGYSIITRDRLTSVTNETGGQLSIGYAAPGGACTSGNFPATDANTLSCYPDYWGPAGTTSPVLDWFNKYAVASVTQTDTTGAAMPVVTSYSYSGAAWHYNDDALTRSAQRTWDQWRGFRTVTTGTGTSPDPMTKTVDTYLQGMNGDYQSSGSTSSVTVTDSRGGTVTDSDQYAGTDLESIVYDGTSGGEVTDTITLPWSSAATATQTQPSPLPSLQSFLTGTAETKVYTALGGGGTRESDTTFTHDSYGQVTQASDVPDTSDASQDTCTTTTFAYNTTAWILDLPSEVTEVSVPCTATPALPADAISDKITLYDGATSVSKDTPSIGNATETELATTYSGSTPTYTMQSKNTYDEYGRVLTATDADTRVTTTAYTPATGAEPTQDVVTDPQGLVTTTTYDPARDLPLTTTSPAGKATTEQYDALGRLTAVWTPGNATTGPANDKFAYTVSDSGPSYTTSSSLAPDASSYLESVTIYDSLGRTRETQDELGSGGWDVTDTVYDSAGRTTTTSGPYYESSLPAAITIIGAPEDEVNTQDTKVYDGAGRVIKDVSSSEAAETWETDTAYGGDYTTTSYSCAPTVPSCGGTPQTTFTDGRGLTTATYQYHSGTPADPADPASDYDKTSYTWTPARELAGITDAAGNARSYTYDRNGNITNQAAPDAGTTASTYDAAGQLLTSTSADGKTTSYVYDKDGRKTAEYDTTHGAAESSSDEIASWTYDTLAKGDLTSASSYYGGQAYTEAIGGYNAFGEPTETYTTIPPAQGKLAGNYVTVDTYTAAGQLASYEDSPAGGLPQETVSYGYNTAAQPISETSSWAYVSSLSYDENGLPQEYTMGPTSAPAYIVDTYDPQTQRLTEQQTSAGVTPQVIDDQHYSYNNVGSILAENDTPASGPAQAQCFQYDYLGRLVQAWSQGTDCTTSSTPSTTAESGAEAPYWDSYTYNAIGNLTAATSTAASGTPTTTTETYPAAGAAQPHAPTTEQVSGGSTGSTSYTYDAAGQLTGETGLASETLNWSDDGKLSSITSPATATSPTSSYFYDASGNLLIEKDPGQTTLFLGDEEVVLNTSAGTLSDTLSGTRYYTIGGITIAARTSAGSIQYLAGDQQGTSSVAIDSGTLAVTRRYYDPYGNELSPEPSSWPGVKGFVGGTQDTATGLVNLGAREYNPASAQFASPDPLLDPSNPQDLNPYAYAYDSPATNSDPSGARVSDGTCNGSDCYDGDGSSNSSNSSNSGSTGTNRNSDSGTSGNPYGNDSYFQRNPEICGQDCLGPLPGAPGGPPVPRFRAGPGAKAASHTTTNGSSGDDAGCARPGWVHSRFAAGDPGCVPPTSPAAQQAAEIPERTSSTTVAFCLDFGAGIGLAIGGSLCWASGPHQTGFTVSFNGGSGFGAYVNGEEVLSNASSLQDFASGWGTGVGEGAGPVAVNYSPGNTKDGRLASSVGVGVGLNADAWLGKNYVKNLEMLNVRSWVPSGGVSLGWVIPLGGPLGG